MRFKNYRNPYTNDNRIYSFKDLYDMPFGELIRKKQEVLGQYRVLGVPREEELQSSENVVHVEAYTREDGTEVKAHYRSKPGGGSVNNTVTDDIKTEEPIQEKQEVQTDKNIQEQNQDNKQQPEQAEKETDEQLYPKEIAGVKRGKPMSPSEAGGKNVNPNYDSSDDGYKINCTSCVPVHWARKMGFNIEALPAREDDPGQVKMLRRYPYYAFEPKEGETNETPVKIRSNNAKECIKQMEENIKQGECYEFWYHPPKTEDGFAHTVEIYKNNKNELEIYDPQGGQTYGKEYFDKIDYKKREGIKKYYYPQYIYRIDNKVPKHDILEKISRPAQRQIQ